MGLTISWSSGAGADDRRLRNLADKKGAVRGQAPDPAQRGSPSLNVAYLPLPGCARGRLGLV